MSAAGPFLSPPAQDSPSSGVQVLWANMGTSRIFDCCVQQRLPKCPGSLVYPWRWAVLRATSTATSFSSFVSRPLHFEVTSYRNPGWKCLSRGNRHRGETKFPRAHTGWQLLKCSKQPNTPGKANSGCSFWQETTDSSLLWNEGFSITAGTGGTLSHGF